jgi:UPF0755 protein
MAKRTRTGLERARWLVWVLLAALAAAGTALDLLVIYPSFAGPGDGETRLVEVPRGVGPERLTELLREEGLIDSPGRFRLWLRLGGRMPEVRAGRFELRDDSSPERILEVLSGRGIERGARVTVPEGRCIAQIASALEEAAVTSAADFLSAASDERLLRELNIPNPTAEGYLFPDTYFFDRDAKAAAAVRRMHAEFERRWSDLGSSSRRDRNQVVTLASIVQAEARVAAEMPTIAGVYHNRLTSPEFSSRLLNADPTVAYGCDPIVEPRAPSCAGFDGELTRAQLSDEANRYNTYVHPGLPPGPICNPGLAALRAALEPAEVPYFYFVAGGPNGRHLFAVTLAEHRRNVKRYLGEDSD